MGLENEKLEHPMLNNPGDYRSKLRAKPILSATRYQHYHVRASTDMKSHIITNMFSHHVVCLKSNT